MITVDLDAPFPGDEPTLDQLAAFLCLCCERYISWECGADDDDEGLAECCDDCWHAVEMLDGGTP